MQDAFDWWIIHHFSFLHSGEAANNRSQQLLHSDTIQTTLMNFPLSCWTAENQVNNHIHKQKTLQFAVANLHIRINFFFPLRQQQELIPLA
jgi:hypothetical protein